ncbi:MAG: hypothetical protein AB7L13_15195 [Acidimicrobiia bacterium]
MDYPLEAGGLEYYPVKVGSALITMVDPHLGFEKAYNRWYERDHYYDGCMVGPWMYAGSRWVAPRNLKALRWPTNDETVARPPTAGSYVSIYWVEEGHHTEHFTDWAPANVRDLYLNGRGFSERRHIHTVVVDHLGAVYRDEDPVPVALALDHVYTGVYVLWFDGNDPNKPASELHAELSKELLPKLVADSTIEIASSWTPSVPEKEGDPPRPPAPMDLGSGSGRLNRLVQVLFVDGSVEDLVPKVKAYTDAVEASGLATTRLVAPFYRTVVGTDRYVDELWP